MIPQPPMPIARSEASAAGVSGAARFLTVSLARELGILLCLSVLFPFMIHVIPVPGNAQLGPRLLPMFYAPLLAALWGRSRSAFLVALLAPWLNWALTSHPAPLGAIVMMVQLVVFVVMIRLMLKGVGAHWFLAALAYFTCLAASVLLAAAFPALIGGQAVLTYAVNSVSMGLPGIAILVLINWLVVRHYPPGQGGNGPIAA